MCFNAYNFAEESDCNMKTVFIDGKEGTTGLQIVQRISERSDIKLISLPENLRKDAEARRNALNQADVAILCLPDSAAIEAVSMVDNSSTIIIDASTAHRTAEGWVYGLPELSSEHKEKIKKSKRIAVPGCHASGFISLLHPLVNCGIIKRNALLTCHSVTGYSGGGKKMIAEYESDEKSELLCAPRQYALSQSHKHLKEMTFITGLEAAPIFSPIVSDFYSGMVVTVPVFLSQLEGAASAEDIKEIYKKLYNKKNGGRIAYRDDIGEGGFISAAGKSRCDDMEIYVEGNEDRILLIARYDNLGKGASGAAVQCLDLALGNTD